MGNIREKGTKTDRSSQPDENPLNYCKEIDVFTTGCQEISQTHGDPRKENRESETQSIDYFPDHDVSQTKTYHRHTERKGCQRTVDLEVFLDGGENDHHGPDSIGAND